MSTFELELVGGPWGKRLARRRAGLDELDWDALRRDVAPDAALAARCVWTQSAFSEYASAAAFAEIAAALLRAGAPIDLVAAAGEFVADEMMHAELCARVASALGGAVPLEVDLQRLVRPPDTREPHLFAAVLLVRTSCVGEALTVPILSSTRAHAGSQVIQHVIARILKDESAHAQLGPWYLDWAAERLSDQDRAELGRCAGEAVRAFAPMFDAECSSGSGAGVLDCPTFDAAFDRALRERVVPPLAARGIVIPAEDLAAVA